MPEVTLTSNAYITGIQRLKSDAVIVNTRFSLNSDAFIAAQRTTIICDGGEVINIISEFGTDVVVRVVSKSFPDEYGDATLSFTDYRKRCMVMRYTANDQDVREGIFKAGELIFSFSPADVSYIVTGNRILYGGAWYEIREIIEQPMVDILYYLQARVQKV